MSGDEEESKAEEEEGRWSWEMWKRHFALIEESERLVDELQLQLRTAIYREDYKSAHKLKLAIAATARNDTVGRAISDLNVRDTCCFFMPLLLINDTSDPIFELSLYTLSPKHIPLVL
jgi:hypothetical protein